MRVRVREGEGRECGGSVGVGESGGAGGRGVWGLWRLAWNRTFGQGLVTTSGCCAKIFVVKKSAKK